jgi:hypothetical protein
MYVTYNSGDPTIEIFPKQDQRGTGGFGNFMWLPLHGESLKTGRTAILDGSNGLAPLNDQWDALQSIKCNGLEILAAAMAVVEKDEPTRNRIKKITPPVVENIPEGRRNNALTSLAGSLWRTMQKRGITDVEPLAAALLSINEERCDPPLPESEVEVIARSVGKYSASETPPIVQQDLPIVYADMGDLPTATNGSWRAIERANANEPWLFRRGGRPVRIGVDDVGGRTLETLLVDGLRYETARVANWRMRGKGKKKGVDMEARPPLDVIRDMLATPAELTPLLPVDRITDVPTCDADGNLCDRPGYNPGNRTYYTPARRVMIPTVPTNPTERDVRQARETLVEPLFDFPFKTDADLAHLLALGILPFCREMIDGPTPMHAVSSPVPGTGKTKSVDATLYPATGGNIGIVTQTSEDETRKRITTELLRGRVAVLFDNINRPLDSAVLSAALTTELWTDRRMAKHEDISLPNKTAWVMTANNPVLSLEIARRCIRSQLDPRTEKPWEREGFRHPDLKGWLCAHRGELIAANLTLIRGWVAAGKPRWTGRVLGGFESWSRIIGGILANARIGGFLGNLEELYASCDLEGAIWREITTAWWGRYKSKEVGIAELFPLADDVEALDLGKGGERSQRTVLGKKLAGMKDRVVGGFRIVKGRESNRASLWQLLPTAGGNEP